MTNPHPEFDPQTLTAISKPKLVEDMLALIGRNDPIVERTTAEIQADKDRLAKAKTASAKTMQKRRKMAQ